MLDENDDLIPDSDQIDKYRPQIVYGLVALLLSLSIIVGFIMGGAYACEEVGGFFANDIHCHLNYTEDGVPTDAPTNPYDQQWFQNN